MKFSRRALFLAATLVATGGIAAQAAEVTIAHDRSPYVDVFEAVAALKDLKLNQASYGDVDAFKTYVQQSVQTGDVSDVIVWWSGKTLEDMVGTGQFASTEDIWQQMISSGRFPAGLKSAFEVDGVAYGLPFGVVNWMVWYNKELFAKAGVASTPKTWSELEEVVDKLKAADIKPFVATIEGGWRPFIWFEEVYIKTDPEGFKGLFNGENTYDSDRTRAVFQKWADLYADGWFADARSNQEDVDFIGGKGAMLVQAENRSTIIVKAGFKPENLGVFLLPVINADLEPNVIVEPTAMLVSKRGIDKPEVRAFVDAWLSKEGGNLWAKGSGWLTGAVDVDLPSAAFEQSYAAKAEAKPANILRWWESTPAGLQMELNAEISAFMVDPTMATAEKVMKNMAALVETEGN